MANVMRERESSIRKQRIWNGRSHTKQIAIKANNIETVGDEEDKELYGFNGKSVRSYAHLNALAKHFNLIAFLSLCAWQII